MAIRTLSKILIAAALATALASAAQGVEPRKLRVADSFPKGHYLVKLILEPWMESVTKRTGGAVTFEYYPAQQLGKAADMLTLTQTGVADIGYVAPSYVAEKMPVSEVAQLPSMFETTCQGTLAYWRLARDNGIIAQQDYAPNRIRLLIAETLPQYRIFTIKAPVQKMADASGLKLRTTGGAQDLTLRAISAVPVRMAAPDAYESLTRGTLDGLLFPLDSVSAYGMEKVVKFATDGIGFGSFIVAYSISETVWSKLEPEVRNAMREAADEVVPQACAAIQKAEDESKTKFKELGVQFGALAPAEKAQFQDALKNVNKKWAEALDARGKKASDVLKQYEAAVHAQPAH